MEGFLRDPGLKYSLQRVAVYLAGLALCCLILTGCSSDPEPLRVAAGEANDLSGALESSGIPFELFPSVREAVEDAPRGSGVLFLADNYPEETLEISEEVLEKARQKELRVFLEFPGKIGDLECSRPGRDRLSRGVVDSGFFGQDLPPSRILAINGMSFVRLDERGAIHMRSARVAGLDRAIYGVPEESYPLLLEADLGGFAGNPGPAGDHFLQESGSGSAKGSILVSATGMSSFIRGRYAPEKDWKVVWQKILEWTAGRDMPEIRWNPTVRPSFGQAETLPPGAEKNAFRRGVEWFENSRMIASDPMIEMAGSKDGFLIPWKKTWPAGDGSSGSLEAVMSVVDERGEQPLGAVLRGDCIAETSMAMAVGAAVLSHEKYAEVSRNLLDFYLVDSRATKNERGDPRHGAYGLIAWGISSDAWYKANYGDDNARVMLAALAASAILEENRWNDAIMRCLLGNLRTTGQKGFRTSRIDIEALEKNGWKHYFEESPVHLAPHFEAYLWACYLLAYEKTGFDLFRERAKTAIRITMDSYPEGLRWTNGLSQEMARMILPLAWLVRVEDTPENRGLLQRALRPLLDLQEECGAIRELLGDPDKGKYPPPRSNQEYGSNEASLIAENGDRISDLLYTVNFAFLGLHEAASATGDPETKEACDRLAEFLVRIQARTEKYPYLEGGWFRAFDFGRWEFYASNADIGWGAWCIESGWTQGWITAVLGFRQMNISLWDLALKPEIEKNFIPLKDSMMPGI